MRRVAGTALVLLVAIVTSAHVGSPNVVFDGMAGPYAVRVIVRPPMVVPGLADVVVRTTSADVQTITVRPVFLRVGAAGAPEGDVAKRVAGDSALYSAQVWLMRSGAYSVYVTMNGARGSGTVVVPVMSVATGRLGIAAPLAAILAVLGVALVAGLVTIVRAGAGESLVPPGDAPDPRRRRRANLIAALSMPVIAICLFGGARWWSDVDTQYQRSMFRPPPLKLAVTERGGARVLMLATRDGSVSYSQLAPLIPDHGKLMHLFLVSESDVRTFAHLHPVQGDSGRFTTSLPPIPPGRYQAFADVTTELGTSMTLRGTVDVPATASPTSAALDPDDGWTTGRAFVSLQPGAADTVETGTVIAWNGAASDLVAARATDLRFEVRGPNGARETVEPYLGMAGHAVIARDDGSVFIHLHPMGTISMAVQRLFELRDRGDTTRTGRLRIDDSAAATTHAMPVGGALSFPYEFPKPGRYHIWVQVKRNGRVLTGSFAADVR